MNLATFIFYAFIIMAAASALSILFIKNVFYAALLLIVCLLSIAGIFILSNSEFLAATQIMIYAGGVLVLIIFGLMLTAKISGKPLHVGHQNVIPGTLVAFSFFVILIYTYSGLAVDIPSTTRAAGNSVNTIGILLLTDFVLPFEVSGILLLTSLIGAAITASSFSSKK
jgi:NADH:ubiquinone oxidoreductase subunit 6 (subunit J)